MVTDTRDEQQMTIADLCQAIAEGQVRYTVEDGHYRVKRAELCRLRVAREHEAIPVELLHVADAAAAMRHSG